MDPQKDVPKEEPAQPKEKRKQPPWHKPEGTVVTGLKVNNSLCNKQYQDFVPAQGKLIKWYTCGPTVYDSSHLGHARNYLTFDILRRIMEDYFGYNVFYVMNITDIDDKIITKARQNHFFKLFLQENPKLTIGVENQLLAAWEKHIATLNVKLEKNKVNLEEKKGNLEEKKAAGALLEENLTKAQAAVKLLKEAELGQDSSAFILAAQGPLSELLDEIGHRNLDPEFVKTLCSEHAQYYEKDFFDDMHALGIKDPDVLTRVTEYVPAILRMVNKIIERGYAYPSEGSVYFDVAKFHSAQGHDYAKLSPEKVGDDEALKEGEGNLGATGEKKAQKDFALWKASKPGEPHWPSENKFEGSGLGRPGWHIECSAMAGELFGDNMDIHGGGWDLKFPHHDNEMAQSEAFFDNQQWVNYFLHSGHLNIDGLKMSKSLKNFITIKDILAKYTPTQLRLFFLIQRWDQPLNYQRKDTMLEVNSKIKGFVEFFNKVKMMNMDRGAELKIEAWSPAEIKLNQALLETQDKVHQSLCNNFDTKSVIQHLLSLVTLSNVYMTETAGKKVLLLNTIVAYIQKMLNIFGIQSFETQVAGVSSENREEILFPYVRELTSFRKSVRDAARAKEGPPVFLGLCDALRDEKMIPLGVKIVDDSETPFFFADPAQLQEEARLKAEEFQAAQAKKRTVKIENLTKTIAALKKGAKTPEQYILETFNVVVTDKNQIPDTDKNEKKFTGGEKKKILKEWNAQEKAHAKYLADIAQKPTLLADTERELEGLKGNQ